MHDGAALQSIFDTLVVLPEDPILGLAPLFKNDQRNEKVNLGIGTYKNDKGQPHVFSAVKGAEKELFERGFDKEYQPIDGSSEFQKGVLSLVIGEKKPEESAAIETLGGSGALRLAGDLLLRMGIETLAIPDPSWSNHFGLFKSLKNLPTYPYYDPVKNERTFSAMAETLKELPPKAAVLLHASCHNPTGSDLSLEEWKELEALMRKKELFPVFDFAYHGYKEGLEEDLEPMRYFLEKGTELFICYSLSKSLSLYGERVGALIAVSNSKAARDKIVSQAKNLIRQAYSSPPLHGARIASTVLHSKQLSKLWEEELRSVRSRIRSMRALFAKKWEAAAGGNSLDYIKEQHGLFSLIGLSRQEVLSLRKDYAVYMPENGRINFAGLNEGNLDYTVESIAKIKRANLR